MSWEDAYDEYLKDMYSRPSQVFGWINHPIFPGQHLLVNYSVLIGSYETH